MKVRKLSIDRLPGIDTPFKIDVDNDGFHVIHGPNGIGKSSICRGIEALLWAEHGPNQRTSLTGEFDLNDETWSVERENGQIDWRRNNHDSSPPFIPSTDLRHCFFLNLRDLIDLSKDGTEGIATTIRKEMAGGVDLDQIVKANFTAMKRPGQKESQELEEKNRAIQKAGRAQEELQKKADNLGQLQLDLKEAESCEQQRANIALTVTLAKYRGQLDELAQTISSFPASLSKLKGSEYEDVDEAKAQIEILESRLETNRTNHAEALAKKDGSRLEAAIDQATLDVWGRKETELRNSKQDRDNKRQAHEGDAATLDVALKAVGKVDHEPTFELENDREIFDFLRKAQDLANKRDAIKARIQLLENINSTVANHPINSRTSDGVEALRRWLRTGTDAVPRKKPWLSIVLLIVLAALGTGLAWTANPWFVSLTGLGGGALLALVFRQRRKSETADRKHSQSEFEKSGLTGPEHWELACVERCLRDLEHGVSKQRADEIYSERHRSDLESLKNDLEGLNQGFEEIDDVRQGLIKQLNLEDIPRDVDLVDFAVALNQLRLAAMQEQGSAKLMASANTQYHEQFEYLADAFEKTGEPRPADLDHIVARLKSITRRHADFNQAAKDAANAELAIEQTNSDLLKFRGQIKASFEAAGLEFEDFIGLKKLMTDLPAYVQFVEDANVLKRQIESDRRKLEQAGQIDLLHLTLDELNQKATDLAALAETAPELHREIADINAETKLAQDGNNIESLIADRDGILSRLHDKRDQAIRAKVGQLLLATVEQEHETTQMPRVLAHANHLFGSFTHLNYKIELDKGHDQPRLVAIDQTSQKRQSIEELSDGTRTQLLLSARIAFAKEAEQGTPFPLFLDEALDQSDPERTNAIVRSLGRVARDQNRQIFYLTSDPSDLVRIQQALAEEKCAKAIEIDLGAIRAASGAVGEPSSLYVAPRPRTPEPGSLSAEDYGVLINATPFDPSTHHSNQHLFHVLWDQLSYLHEMLAIGIVSVGQWQSIAASDFAKHSNSQTVDLLQVGYRVDLLRVFCDLWQQGRGIPVDRDVLIESNAVSDTYLDGLAEIVDEVNYDAEALIDVIKIRTDHRLSGFRTKKGEELEQYLLDKGHIDEKPTLTEESLLPLALAAPVAAKLSSTVASDCLHRWWRLPKFR